MGFKGVYIARTCFPDDMGGIIGSPEGLPESSSDEISDSIDVSVEFDSNVVDFFVAPVLLWAFSPFFDRPGNDMNIP